ncbi:MAG: hypothetical protein ACK58L_10960 [Planctomycetota bacterium]
MSSEINSESGSETPTTESLNVVALAGIGFALITAILYAVLFYLLRQLPTSREGLDELRTNTTAITRFLIVGASAGLLNVVSLILCLIGYVLPRRSRLEAVIGSVLSAIMMLAVFSVIVVALLLTP